MKQIDLLPLSEEKKKRLNSSVTMYRRYAHIVIEVISFDNERLIVRAEQKDLVNGKKLNKKELTERVREMFRGEIPNEWKLTISATDFDRKDIDTVNVTWISEKMSKLGLRNKTIASHTGIDKCTLSSILKGDKELTKWHKVAFYYFFKYYEVAQF